MQRRAFLKKAASLAIAPASASIRLPGTRSNLYPVIDTHIHLYDPSRPGGVPWPEKSDRAIYRPALPGRYRRISQSFGIVGAIAIECSPLKSDNWWLLRVAERNPIIVGVIGDLEPGTDSFRSDIAALRTSPLFLGIRYGNLWGRDFAAALTNPTFLSDLKWFSETGMVLESANPDAALIFHLLRLSDLVPDLRIVIDHLPQAQVPTEAAGRERYYANLRELAKRPHIYVKLSELLRRSDGRVSTDVSSYEPLLDQLWEMFGPDRVMYGSDWPNSDHLASYAQTFRVVQDYVLTKTQEARQKVLWENSITAYRWKARSDAQRRLPI